MTELGAEVQNDSASSIYVIRIITISLVKIHDVRVAFFCLKSLLDHDELRVCPRNSIEGRNYVADTF